MSNTKIKPTKEIGISDKSLKKNQNMLNSINEIKTSLMQKAEIEVGKFNELKVSFGTKSDLRKVITYLFNYAQWDAKDVVYLETAYNAYNEAYNKVADDTTIVKIDYIYVDCLFKHLEKEKSIEDYRTRGLKGTIMPIYKYDDEGNVEFDENKKPKVLDTFSLAYLKMLVTKANQETTVARLEYQSLAEQIKLCDEYLQRISMGQMPAESIEIALKQVEEKYSEKIKKEK